MAARLSELDSSSLAQRWATTVMTACTRRVFASIEALHTRGG